MHISRGFAACLPGSSYAAILLRSAFWSVVLLGFFSSATLLHTASMMLTNFVFAGSGSASRLSPGVAVDAGFPDEYLPI